MKKLICSGRNGLTLVAFLTATALLSACSTRTAQTAPSLAVPVSVAKAVQKTVPIELTAIGTGEAYSKVSIEAQVNAILDSVHFQQGDFVKKGQLLFSLDARPFQAALAQAEGNLAKDRAQAQLAHVEAERYTKLFKEGVAAKEQYDQYQSTAEADDAAVRADEAAVEAAQLNLQYCTINSPIDGRTGALQIYPGNLVKQNDVPVLIVINQITPIYVDFAVPEQYLSVIKKYMALGRLPVQAVPYGDAAPETGYLVFVDNAVDNTTGTIKLKGTFPNPDHRLWPGQFSTVNLRLSEEENAIIVPSQAIQAGQNGSFVYVVSSDNHAENRPVKVARTIGGETVVSEGIKPGETVVTDGQLRLLPGVEVQIRAADSGDSSGN